MRIVTWRPLSVVSVVWPIGVDLCYGRKERTIGMLMYCRAD
jgi:hypothetical protein